MSNAKQIVIDQEQQNKELGDLFGIFFEDINHAADGGLYAELVQNRSFEYCEVDHPDYHALTAWIKSDDLSWDVHTTNPLHEDNPHYLSVQGPKNSWLGNLGYNSGIYVEQEKEYIFSLFARTVNTDETVLLHISIEDAASQIYAQSAPFQIQGTQWQQYQIILKARHTTICGRLKLTLDTDAALNLDMISLFPKDTFQNRPNGLRKDIAEALAEMKPKFVRFPGGCLVHDGSLNDHDRNSMYRWKRTLGKIEERPSWRNNWGYNQTLGLGFYEYFCFCEDIGAKPLPVLPGGFNPHKGEGVALSALGEWVQDALDLIEFANGDTHTKWGKIRAELGHANPFYLEYLGIGNEEIGNGFFERYPYFHKAIREKYPEIKIINTAGPFAVGEGYEDGWHSARENGSDLIDEHYYSSPEWFLANMHHYDDYDENGTKVFLGEYASWGNAYYNALVEAAYMTHLEKAKAVSLACYAPLLCNADYVNWRPDMIWFDNHRMMKTPNYYVQKLFMRYQGTQEVSIRTQGLDEIISLTDHKNITGTLAISGNDIDGDLWDICLTNHENDTLQKFDAFQVTKDRKLIELCSTDSAHYTLSFRFKRTLGRKGLNIFFGRQDSQNQFCWDFGGWDNWDCNLNSSYHGKGSVISHRIFHVEEKEYLLQLEIKNRTITTYVNGEVYNQVTDHLPQLEELYLAASIDAEYGQTYLKAVNLTGETKETTIQLEGRQRHQVKIYALRGFGLADENTLEDPQHIVPVEETAELTDNKLSFTFAPHSVTVLAFS